MSLKPERIFRVIGPPRLLTAFISSGKLKGKGARPFVRLGRVEGSDTALEYRFPPERQPEIKEIERMSEEFHELQFRIHLDGQKGS